MLSSLSCPSAKLEILKSIFILYNDIQHSLPASNKNNNVVTNESPLDFAKSAPALLSRSVKAMTDTISPILKGLESASQTTIEKISNIFHQILYDSTSILSNENCEHSLRASILGIWSMSIASQNSNKLYSETKIFSILSDILSQSNDDNNIDQFQRNDFFECIYGHFSVYY